MNMNYTVGEIYAVCPYCFNKQDEYPDVDIGEEIDIECCKCGKNFHVSAHVSFDTKADCELNGTDHDWYDVEGYPGLVYCRNCPMVKR